MNILHIFATLPIGGAEEHLRTVLRNIDTERFNSLVCCIGEKGSIGKEIEASGVEVISLGRMKKKGWDASIPGLIRAIIRERSIDLVHTQLYHANMYGRIAAQLSGVPVISTEHNVYPKYKLKRRFINWVLSKRTDRIIAVSKPVRDYIIKRDGLDPNKVVVIYNGIEVERFASEGSDERTKKAARRSLGLDEDALTIGMICRLSEQKGHIYLMRAFVNIKKTLSTDVKLVIVGTGPLEEGLKREAVTLGIGVDVVFLGARRDVPHVLKAFDIYVLPSLWEGHPLSLLEAMASSLPVVATSVGGVPDVIVNGENGVMVEPRDVDGLTRAAIDLLINNPSRAEAIGNEGRRLVEEAFSASTMVTSMEALYEASVSAKSSGQRKLPASERNAGG